MERAGDPGKAGVKKRDGVVTAERIDDAMRVESRTASQGVGFAKRQRDVVSLKWKL